VLVTEEATGVLDAADAEEDQHVSGYPAHSKIDFGCLEMLMRI
jgi:hypothetical protein